MEIKELYSQFRPLLFIVAYRMLGTVSEAEDIVHDVFVQVSEKTIEHVENKKAYFCKIVTNKCIDFLKSARYQREVYPGPWLPEPLLLNDNDPIYEVINEETVSFAFLLLLEKLKPIERAVFILREVLEYDYIAISQILNRSEPSCRKLFSRVKKKFPLTNKKEENASVTQNNKIKELVVALQQGDLQKIEGLLNKEVTLYSDGGGKVLAALKPIHSRTLVIRFIVNLLRQNNIAEHQTIVKMTNVNGGAGLLVMGADKVKTVFSFHVRDDQIVDIYIVRNPEKLKHVSL